MAEVPSEAGGRTTKLTPREAEVVGLIAKGRTNPQIATAMGIKASSVKEYLHRIFGKVHVTNRTELAMWEIRRQEPL